MGSTWGWIGEGSGRWDHWAGGRKDKGGEGGGDVENELMFLAGDLGGGRVLGTLGGSRLWGGAMSSDLHAVSFSGLKGLPEGSR